MAKAVAGLIVVGMVVSIWMLWPRGDPVSPTTTALVAVGSTTITPTTPTSTTVVTSTSTTETTHVVETVEEAEAILRELWFGWFEGIYSQDEDRIREVVATEEFVEAGVDAFDNLEFSGPPSADGISFIETEILFADDECLVIWTTGEAAFIAGVSENSGVDVLRSVNGSWRVLTTWQYKDDLWQDDCKSQL